MKARSFAPCSTDYPVSLPAIPSPYVSMNYSIEMLHTNPFDRGVLKVFVEPGLRLKDCIAETRMLFPATTD
jgi:hypothetical protein